MLRTRITYAGSALDRPKGILKAALFLISLLFISSAYAAELRCIQRGTTTMVSGGKVYVVLGNSIRDTTKAFLVFSETETGGISPDIINVGGQILNKDSLVFQRNNTGGSNLNSISWEVYEFTSGVTVTHGKVNTTANPTNITLNNSVRRSETLDSFLKTWTWAHFAGSAMVTRR